MTTIVQEKVNQAIQLLKEKDIDIWLTFVRETPAAGDPVLPLIYGLDLTWQSALILTRNGERIAIVGRFEKEAALRTEAYSQVIDYDQSIRSTLVETLGKLQPRNIAINYSHNEVYADGLSVGLYQVLLGYLSGTPYADRLISAEGIIRSLIGRKTTAEIKNITTSVERTNSIFQDTFRHIKPGLTERQLADYMHSRLQAYGVGPAWQMDSCPTVNVGPDSPIGHSLPTDIKVTPGHLIHFDFGVKNNGYCSDIQRMVYMLKPNESKPPEVVINAFNVVVNAIEATVAFMKPGLLGKDVDKVARNIVTAAGFPEYMYGTGHHLGRNAHDGGGILGPEWEKYGSQPTIPLEVGNVFTVEPGLYLPEYGYIGLEEDVMVTEEGAEYLCESQKELVLVRGY